MNVTEATKQWAERGPDERFWTLEDFAKSARARAEKSVEVEGVEVSSMRAEARYGEIVLVGDNGRMAGLTHYAMGQLCQRVKAPHGYLASLPAEKAADCLSYGLGRSEDTANVLIRATDGGDRIQAVLSAQYGRVWNWQVADALEGLGADGWAPPPAWRSPRTEVEDPSLRLATEADCGPWTLVRPGDLIGPAGLYASDRDMFVFLVNPSRTLETGSEGGAIQGLIVRNSEVGDAALECLGFWLIRACGNHGIALADGQGVKAYRRVHRGEKVFTDFPGELAGAAGDPGAVGELEGQIRGWRDKVIGADRQEVVSALREKLDFPLKTAERAWDAAVAGEGNHGAPNRVWGVYNGLTEVAKAEPYASGKVSRARDAAKVLRVKW